MNRNSVVRKGKIILIIEYDYQQAFQKQLIQTYSDVHNIKQPKVWLTKSAHIQSSKLKIEMFIRYLISYHWYFAQLETFIFFVNRTGTYFRTKFFEYF